MTAFDPVLGEICDPMSPMHWTLKSGRQLAKALPATGHQISYLDGRLPAQGDGLQLQAPSKTVEGAPAPRPRRPVPLQQPGAERRRSLMVTADAGGSNGYRNRLWKAELDLDDSRYRIR